MSKKLIPEAGEHCGYYVYLYIDPTDKSIFYVGKGQKNRAIQRLNDDKECRVTQRIGEIRKKGNQPQVEILQMNLTEKEALRLESAAIDLIGLDKLTNEVRGHALDGQRRDTWEAIQASLTASPITVTEPVILINIRQTFNPRLTDQELYDATRSAWRVKKDNVKRDTGSPVPVYAFAMASGIVREVYRITDWFPAGTTMPNKQMTKRDEGRWEFVGQIDRQMSNRYRGKKVDGLSPKLQNPIRYLNCIVEDETPVDPDVEQPSEDDME